MIIKKGDLVVAIESDRILGKVVGIVRDLNDTQAEVQYLSRYEVFMLIGWFNIKPEPTLNTIWIDLKGLTLFYDRYEEIMREWTR